MFQSHCCDSRTNVHVSRLMVFLFSRTLVVLQGGQMQYFKGRGCVSRTGFCFRDMIYVSWIRCGFQWQGLCFKDR